MKSIEKEPTSPALRRLDAARMEIVRLAPHKGELSDVFRDVCRVAAEALEVERVGIWLLVHDCQAIRCACLYERTRGEYSEGITLSAAEFPDYFASLAERKTIPAENAVRDPRTSQLEEAYLLPLGITSMLDAPIHLASGLAGVVCHEHVGPTREWTTEERDFAGSVADLVALKIKGAQLRHLRQLLHDREVDRVEYRHREDIARLAAGVAHDFRNILGVVLGNATALLEDLPPDSPSAGMVVAIRDAARRGAALAAQLVDAGRSPTEAARILDPNEVIEAYRPLLENLLTERHRLELWCEPGVGKVFIERTQLERILLNLVLNARDAMMDGGIIRVTTAGNRPASQGRIELRVEDKGGGIDAAILNRIFEPFFTTKTNGQGTGLGLTVVRQAVDHAGGTLRLENRPGHGATFIVELPRAAVG